MKTLHSFALELLVGVGIALQAWTLSNVVDVRERVARLEARSASPASSELDEPARPRILILDERIDERSDERRELIVAGGIEGPAARHAELYERLSARRGGAGPPVIPDEPRGIADARAPPGGGIHAR